MAEPRQDPFLPEDPRLRDDPMFKYIAEAKQLSLALVDRASLSSVIEALRNTDKRDLERVAMLALAMHAHEAIAEVSKLEGLTDEQANARWVHWVIGAPSDATLDEV